MANIAIQSLISFESSPKLTIDNIDDARDIVFTRGVEDALYFGAVTDPRVSRENTSTSESDINHRSHGSITMSESALSKSFDLKKSTRSLAASRGKLSSHRVNSSGKSIHKIPIVKTEAQTVKDLSDSNNRISRSAPSNLDLIQIDVDSKTKYEYKNPVISKEVKLSADNNSEQTVKSTESTSKYSNLVHDIVTDIMVEPVDTMPIVISESFDSKSKPKASARSATVCWGGHLHHIKSHCNMLNKGPRDKLFKKNYTSVVDVNSQYNFVSQDRNNTLKSMTWVHRMIVPDFKDGTEPIKYDQSCYFVKKKSLAHRPKSHLTKLPLKLEKTSFDSTSIQVNETEKIKTTSNVELINLKKSSNASQSSDCKNVAFWELKDNLIPQKLFLQSQLPKKQVSFSIDDIQKVEEKNKTGSETFIESLVHDTNKNRLLSKKTTIDLKTTTSKPLEQFSKNSNLIRVETDGWDKIKKLEIQVDDFKDCVSELIFDPTERAQQHPKLDLTPMPLSETLKSLGDDMLLMAIGHDIFKTSNITKTRPINFSDVIQMIQFIVEINRRISIFQRIIQSKRSSFKKRNQVEYNRVLTEKQSKIWTKFTMAVELLRSRFPNQFSELESSPKRIPLQSQFEKIIVLIHYYVSLFLKEETQDPIIQSLFFDLNRFLEL